MTAKRVTKLLTLAVFLISDGHSAIYNAYGSNSEYNCSLSGINDTCIMHCDGANGGPFYFDCGNAGECYFYCLQNKCMENGILNAKNSNNLYAFSSRDQCMINNKIYAPIDGNVYIGINNKDQKELKRMKVYGGNNTKSININCTGSGTEDCRQIEVYAQNTKYLQITGNDGSIMESAQIYCPQNSLYLDGISCNIDFSKGGTIKSGDFYTLNGIPSDIMITGTLSGTVTLHCLLGQIVNNGDSFENEGVCWNTNDPTSNPTKSPTINPSIYPTMTPSVYPTKMPSMSLTINPSIYPTVTPSANPTKIPSVSPTIIPSKSPTFNPSTYPTMIPSENPTTWSTTNPSTNTKINSSINPTTWSTTNPTINPSTNPTMNPSTNPTMNPTMNPSNNNPSSTTSTLTNSNEKSSNSDNSSSSLLMDHITKLIMITLAIIIIISCLVAICMMKTNTKTQNLKLKIQQNEGKSTNIARPETVTIGETQNMDKMEINLEESSRKQKQNDIEGVVEKEKRVRIWTLSNNADSEHQAEDTPIDIDEDDDDDTYYGNIKQQTIHSTITPFETPAHGAMEAKDIEIELIDLDKASKLKCQRIFHHPEEKSGELNDILAVSDNYKQMNIKDSDQKVNGLMNGDMISNSNKYRDLEKQLHAKILYLNQNVLEEQMISTPMSGDIKENINLMENQITTTQQSSYTDYVGVGNKTPFTPFTPGYHEGDV